MTIKFWKNWQKRLKETKYIVLYQLMFADDWENNEYISNYTLNAEDIISYSFSKDNVKISISDYNTNGDRVLATMKLKRIDIKTIIFDKYKKMAKLTKEEFIAEVKDAAGKLRKAHPELRKGQAVFDAMDSNIKYLRAARTTQQQYQIDCFYLDDKIEDFLDKCYEVYSKRYNQMNAL